MEMSTRDNFEQWNCVSGKNFTFKPCNIYNKLKYICP